MPYNADSLLKFVQPGGKPQQADPMAAMKMMGMFTDYLKRYKPPAGSNSLVANSTGNIPASQMGAILDEGGFSSALGGDGVMSGMLSSLAGDAGGGAMASAGGTLASGAADEVATSAITGAASSALADVASWW